MAEELVEMIDVYAKKHNMTRSDIIRLAVVKFLNLDEKYAWVIKNE